MDHVIVGETDDPGFIEILNRLVAGLLAHNRPNQIWIIQIDNWFDHKWLRFSGYGLAASDIPLDRFDTVKAEFRQDKLTFPPFTPNRVLGQWSYVRTAEGYAESPLPVLPHSTERKSSAANLHRRVENFDTAACFIWYSANTVVNGRGSVMIYNTEADQSDCWFAAFNRESAWELQATKGASRKDVQNLLDTKEIF
jgi:hypothetical protein